jgi:hypothetical protein
MYLKNARAYGTRAEQTALIVMDRFPEAVLSRTRDVIQIVALPRLTSCAIRMRTPSAWESRPARGVVPNQVSRPARGISLIAARIARTYSSHSISRSPALRTDRQMLLHGRGGILGQTVQGVGLQIVAGDVAGGHPKVGYGRGCRREQLRRLNQDAHMHFRLRG